jgi:hypothetical protein
LFGYLDGWEVELEKDLMTKDKDGVEVKIPNPAYAQWIAKNTMSFL